MNQIGNKENAVFCLMGPTASGKSALALELARKLNAEIISVDSALVYRGMNIGTAKPGPKERDEIPHHLVDILDPRETYSAGQFCREAFAAIETILAKGKKPLLVGGTMLYFRALIVGLADLPVGDSNSRQRMNEALQTHGLPALYQRLSEIDSVTAARLKSTDTQRILRALEVYELSGKPMSELQQTEKRVPLYEWVQMAVMPEDRQVLHQRIEQRFDEMLARGLIDEVRALYQRGDLHPDLPSIRSVGYRQVWDYLAGRCAYDEMRARAIAATRQLAKRQITWLRHWPGTVHYTYNKVVID